MTTRRRIQKMREAQLLESLDDTCGILFDIIDAVEKGEQEDFVNGIEVAEAFLKRAKRRMERIDGQYNIPIDE